jgi:small subunit ribosomal protein S17
MADTKNVPQASSATKAPSKPRQYANPDRGSRKYVIGLVTSDKMEKTITVRVTRLEKDPKYKKYLKRHSTFYAHDEKGDAKIGDTVEIRETRPLSKLKRWRLVKVMVRAGETGVKKPETKPAAKH